MKKIGIIDYYVGEWHANNYPIWLEKISAKYKVEYVWAEIDSSPVYGTTTDEWCEKYAAHKCATIEDVCEKSDAVMILAPDNSEKHIEYARRVFPFGKCVYIDKTFTSSYEEAKEIFDLSKKYGTPFFSSSSLRYSTELCDFTDVKHLTVAGTVALFHEYIVHQAEIAVKLLASHARKVRLDISGSQRVCRIEADGGKTATLLYVPSMPYGVTAEGYDGKAMHRSIKSDFFVELTKDIVRFFDSGTVSFDVEESLEVMRIHDAVIKAEACPGEWVTVSD